MLESEAVIRLTVFIGSLGLLVVAESLSPRRPLARSRRHRWLANIGVVLLDTLTVRLLFTSGALGAALLTADQGWGLLNLVAWPGAVELVLALILLDLALYAQHLGFHVMPVLWRLHMVHHADPDVDVTTGIRFHPLEVALSMLIKIAVIALVGPSAVAVLLFEVLLNLSSLFNHSNLRLPSGLERGLRWVVVTPDMHRIHHSARSLETNSNFGFNLPWWDRLFGTYRPVPHDGHEQMVLGLQHIPAARAIALHHVLLMPFTETAGVSPSGSTANPRRPDAR